MFANPYVLVGVIAIAVLVLLAFASWAIGFVVIGEDQVGLVTKKFGHALPNGQIIALNGEAGGQVDTLAPG